MIDFGSEEEDAADLEIDSNLDAASAAQADKK